MTWPALLDLIESEIGRDARDRIEARAVRDMAGVRLTVASRLQMRADHVTADSRPEQAAAKLGVHRSTVYRKMRERIIR